MVLHALMRSSTFGQMINTVSGGKILPWKDQEPGYIIPEKYLLPGQQSGSEKTAVNTPDVSGTSTPPDGAPLPRADYMQIHSNYRIIPRRDWGYQEEDQATLTDRPAPIRMVSAGPTLGRRISVCDQLCPYEKEAMPARKRSNTVAVSGPKGDGAPKLETCEEGKTLDTTPKTLEEGQAVTKDSDKTGGPPEDAEIWPEKEDAAELSEIDKIVKKNGYIIVDWEENDSENPRNWPFKRRAWTAGLICALTYSVYLGSAIYTPSIPGIQADLGATYTQGILGLTLFVMGYGIGAMFLTPLQEIPRIGRNPVYISALFLFVVFQLPIIFSFDIHTILAFRFLSGFAGSPALATGGASMGDIFPVHQLAYVIGVWSIGAVLGPLTGPVVGGFAAQYRTWRWPIFELIWVSGLVWIVLFFTLPETFEGTILLRRARRLRKLTGNRKLRSISEIESAQTPATELVTAALIRPFRLTLDPAVLFANVYLGLVYAIFYLWFEAFPIVYGDIHGFSLSISSLPFLSFFVTAALTFAFYVYYNARTLPAYARRHNGLKPEDFLRLGLAASPSIPISLFIFGWTAHSHWIAPTIGAALYFPGIFLLFQTILLYLTISYPKYQGSILAGNDCIRSVIASVFPLFGHHFFTSLGIGPGCSLLAGLSIFMIAVFALLVKYGGRLRAKSKFAQADE